MMLRTRRDQVMAAERAARAVGAVVANPGDETDDVFHIYLVELISVEYKLLEVVEVGENFMAVAQFDTLILPITNRYRYKASTSSTMIRNILL